MRNDIQAIGRLKGLRECGQLIYIIYSLETLEQFRA